MHTFSHFLVRLNLFGRRKKREQSEILTRKFFLHLAKVMILSFMNTANPTRRVTPNLEEVHFKIMIARYSIHLKQTLSLQVRISSM